MATEKSLVEKLKVISKDYDRLREVLTARVDGMNEKNTIGRFEDSGVLRIETIISGATVYLSETGQAQLVRFICRARGWQVPPEIVEEEEK